MVLDDIDMTLTWHIFYQQCEFLKIIMYNLDAQRQTSHQGAVAKWSEALVYQAEGAWYKCRGQQHCFQWDNFFCKFVDSYSYKYSKILIITRSVA